MTNTKDDMTTSTALVMLTELRTQLNQVDTSAAVGRAGPPMLQFKSREGGVWTYGQQPTIIEDDSTWAANPWSFKRGFVAFDQASKSKVVGERLISAFQPMPSRAELPDVGGTWNEQWTVNLKCVSGADTGLEVIYKPTAVGGIQAVGLLIDTVRNRLNANPGNTDIVPILKPGKDSYVHAKHGRIWKPVLTIISWTTMQGPADEVKPEPPAPAPATAAEPPRKRRVA